METGRYTDGITPDYFEKKSTGIGQIYSDMLKIDTVEEAKLYFDTYVEFIRRWQNAHPESKNVDPVEVAQSNLGWCFGEGMPNEKKWMWYRATGASHPIFGMSNPTPKEAFEMGMEWGKGERK